MLEDVRSIGYTPEVGKKAEAGDAEAQYWLALAYQYGRGIERNAEQAFSWLESAAQQGHVKATYLLGGYLHEGFGCRDDKNKALSLLKKAAQKGHHEAKCKLGIWYKNGHEPVLEKNLNKAVSLFYSAAKAGSPFAHYELAMLSQRGEFLASDYMFVLQHYHQAYLIFSEFATAGNRRYQYFCYELLFWRIAPLGLNKKRLKQEGLLWLKQSAIAGYYKAMYEYGRLLSYGICLETTESACLNSHRHCLTRNKEDAHHWVSRCLEVVPVTYTEAEELLRQLTSKQSKPSARFDSE